MSNRISLRWSGWSVMVAMLLLTQSLILAGCESAKSFHVDGNIEGMGTQNLRVYYRDGDCYREATVSAVGGRFSFDGNASKETVVEVYTNSRNLIGRFVARNGDKLKVELSATDQLHLISDGNKLGDKLEEFLAQTDAESLDEAIEKYVGQNPESSLSPLLIGYYYDVWSNPSKSREMISGLDNKAGSSVMLQDVNDLLERALTKSRRMPKLRLLGEGDTLRYFSYSRRTPTLYFFNGSHLLNEATAEKLDSLKDKKVAMAYIRMTCDTFGWHRNRARLPEKMVKMIAQEERLTPTVMELDIPSLPYVIVTDTAGRQIYRGGDLKEAIEKL